MGDNKLSVELTGDNSSFISAMEQASKKLGQFAQDGASASKQFTGSLDGITSSLSGLMAPLAALGGMLAGGKLFKDSVEATVDFSKEVGKLQRVGRRKVGVQLFELAVVEQNLDVLVRVDAEMVAAARADEEA